MNRPSLAGALPPLALLALSLAVPASGAPRKLGVGSALDALGGLRAPLEAQGWSLSTDRSSAISPGDIYDPDDHQVQVFGDACFELDRVRTGVAPSLDLERALDASGRVSFGPWGVSAEAEASIDARISHVEIAEIAVADLRPTEACARQLAALIRDGADASEWYVVQSTLVTDLEVRACAAGRAAVDVAQVGQIGAGAEDCRQTSGARLVLAIRPEPLPAVLAAAGIPMPGSSVRPKRVKRHDGPPCWLDEPCPPYMAPAFTAAVGRGASMGAADEAARAALLDPYALRIEGVREVLGEEGPDEPEEFAPEHVAVADRYSDGADYYSLLVLDRASLDARLDAQEALGRALLSAPPPGDPVAELRGIARALPVAEQLAYALAERVALDGDPGRPDRLAAPVTELLERQQRILDRIAVRTPPGEAGEVMSRALRGADFRTVQGEGPSEGRDAALTLAIELRRPESREVGGMINVTRRATIELRAGDRPVKTVDAEASAGSADARRASADAEDALHERLGQLAVQLVTEALR